MSNNKRKLVYIMSPSYSGSTLLTIMFASHPEIATIGELKATSMEPIEEYQCSCGELIEKCGFWTGITKGMEAKGLDFNVGSFGTHFRTGASICDKFLDSGFRKPVFEFIRNLFINLSIKCRFQRNKILKQNQAIIEEICTQDKKPIFLDDSKDPIRLAHFIHSGLWDVYVVFLTRDGRGATNSYKKHNNVDFSLAIAEFRRTITEMQEIVRVLPAEKSITLKYEDLCHSREDQISKICELIGISDFEFQVYEPDNHHILGNNMRLRHIEEIRLDEKWKTELSAAELEMFDNQVGHINRMLGYTD